MEKTTPKVAWLVINSACNLRCRWCYAKGSEYHGTDMPLGLAIDLVGLIKDLGISNVTLLGGEPTLHPDLVNILNELSRQEIKSWMVTNGKRLRNKDLAQALVVAGLDSVGISIKGASDQQYRELAGNTGYIEAISGLKNLKSLGLEPSVSVTWVRDLANNYKEVLDSLLGQDITHLGMDFGTPFVIGEKISIESILDPRESAELISRVFRYLSRCEGLNFSFYVTFPLCLIEEEVRRQIIGRKLISTTCHMPSGSAVIFDQQGRVLPCCHLSDQFFGQWGVDFDSRQSFELFWCSQAVNDFRKQCQFYPHDQCSNCEQWSICGGGCVLNWTYWSPRDFISDERR